VFAPLEEIDFFKQVQVDPEAGTLVWPNGVDLCPDVLYSLATGKPIHAEPKVPNAPLAQNTSSKLNRRFL
jgi:hypothetical protein